MEQTLTWAEMAEWWDNKQGDTGDLRHRSLIDPSVLKMIGNVSGQQVLDMACGNGYLSRKLAKTGAKVTGVDSSAPIIERNIARETREPMGVHYHSLEANNLEGLSSSTYDLVICNMALMDMPDADGAIREASRVLKRNGRFVASISHPCFDMGPGSAWVIEKEPGKKAVVYRKVSDYRKPHSMTIPWKDGESRWNTISYHRPLSWYFRMLRIANLSVIGFEEPAPSEEFLGLDEQAGRISEIPLHWVFEAAKFA